MGLLLLTVLLCAADSWAQSATDAGVRGRLGDAQGQAIGAAVVRLRPAEQGDAAANGAAVTSAVSGAVSARTDGHGWFTLLGLPPGAYTAEVLLPGAMGWLGPVPLSLEAGGLREIELRPAGGAADSGKNFAHGLKVLAVRADEDGADVEFERGSGEQAGAKPAGGSLPFSELPVADREWEALEEISPVAHDATLAGGGSAQDAAEEDETATARAERATGSPASGLSCYGLPVNQNAQTVDGLSAEQAFGGTPRGTSGGGTGLSSRMGSSFAQGGVSAVRVSSAGFSAQYGGAGGIVSVNSRAAEAKLRATMFAETRQSGWAAVNPYAVVTRYSGGAISNVLDRPAETTWEYGGSMGLPLTLPRVFAGWRAGLFGAVEAQARSETLVSSPETTTFYSLTPTQVALLENRGVGAAAIKGALEYLDGLTGETTVRSPRTVGLVRLDAAPRLADRLSFRVQAQRQTEPVTGGGGVSEGIIDRAVSSVGTSDVRAEAYTAQWQHLFSVRAANSLRLQWTHDLQFETAAAATGAVPAIGPGGFAPQVSIQPEGFVYGTPSSLGRVAYPDEERMEAADSFALRLGRHVVTIGGDWSRVHDGIVGATNLEGAFLYDSGTTGGHDGGLVDWITDYTFNVHAYPNGGCPSIYATVHDFCFHSYAQSFSGAETEFVTHQVSGFAEDALRLGGGLRLTLGMRYDYLLLPFPQTPNAALDAVLRTFGGAAAGVTSSFPEDRNNFGPRASLAWMPGGRRHRWLTLQAGYGLFYGRLPGGTIDAALEDTAQPGSTASLRITPTVETDCPQVANQGFGYPCAFLTRPTGVVAQTTQAVVFSRRFRLPAVQRGMFGVEREVGHRLLLHGEYATAWTTQLPESTDLNIASSTGAASYVIEGGDSYPKPYPGLHTGETFQVPLYTERISSLFGPVTALVSNANATFHSGTMEARLRGFHGFGARVSYTYAKAIDYGPQSSATPRQNGQFDPFSDGYDKGLSSLDFPHHITGDLSFRSEVRDGSAAWRAVASGWRLAATGTAGSGAPYSYVIFGGTRLSGGHESINGSGGATYLPTVGRNTLRLPRRGVANLRLGRELPVRRGLRVQLQADAFNLLNSVSLSRVETRAFLPGTPATTGAPTPLVFQDAATIAAEGLATPAFGTPLSSTSGVSRERQVQFGARLTF